MSKKGARQTYFVCAAIVENKLTTRTVPATSPDEASKAFSDLFSQLPQDVVGPFFKKREQVMEKTRNLKFSDQCKKAIYNDWMVSAILLHEPENQAFLSFIKRIDGRKMPPPKGIITVPVSELRFV